MANPVWFILKSSKCNMLLTTSKLTIIPSFWGLKNPLKRSTKQGQFYYDRVRENYNCIKVQFWDQYVQFFFHLVQLYAYNLLN